MAIAKDPAGTPLIHKAVYYDQPDIVAWLIENYPITLQQKDKVHTYLQIKRNEGYACASFLKKGELKMYYILEQLEY